MNRGDQEVRIVGGSLRGRKLGFPDVPGLRPTPDRVRETLFNWLAPHIEGLRVLDLFAGSGALGIEAISRGAAQSVLVESSALAAKKLRESVIRLGLGNVRVENSDAMAYLQRSMAAGGEGPFDLIFLDPPFDSGLLGPAIKFLSGAGVLAPGGFCYVEVPKRTTLAALPQGWTLHRSGTAGEVGYHLLHVTQGNISRDV
ncbi:MAG: 16S rRNA (guanine(966)-N(2))-methyltransferase RsmD [Pseudomonadota bacterium]